jgi:predicted RNase H-like HicB family nuclease
VTYVIEIEYEADGRWIAGIPALPGVMAYGTTEAQVATTAPVLPLRALADEFDHKERSADGLEVSFIRASSVPKEP